ncbi:MAG: chlorite dismutase family protein [Deltaproteobacteria bacterium]|nr:chlorite dismutase family protein [Deltaproteobacteria bacterium]
MSRRTLNHFAFFRFRKAHETMAAEDRAQFHRRWLEALRSAAAQVEVYQVFPTRADADILVWSALPYEDDQTPRHFFEAFAKATLPFRRYVKSTEILWGMTRPSPYVGGKKPRGMDPIEGKRQSYLTLYPFVKTAEWYGMGREARQGMMNEHIRIGRQFPEVDQLLLYSFGLQDQEFVVVYEMEDLPRYSELVSQLRGCDGRPFTERDTPIYTAVHHAAEDTLALWE